MKEQILLRLIQEADETEGTIEVPTELLREICYDLLHAQRIRGSGEALADYAERRIQEAEGVEE